MPRPKRAKIVHPHPSIHDAQSNDTSSDPKASTIRPARSIRNANSHQTDDIVRPKQNRTGFPLAGEFDEPIAMMSGARSPPPLRHRPGKAAEHSSTANAKKKSTRKNDTNLNEKVTSSDDAIAQRIESVEQEESTGKKTFPTHHGQEDNSNTVRNESLLDESTSTSFPALDSPSVQELSQPFSVSKAQNTPSFLSIKHFKKRPRQPSILSMVKQRLANESDIERDDSIADSLDNSLLGSATSPTGDSLCNNPLEPSNSRKRKRPSLRVESEAGSIAVDNRNDAAAEEFGNIDSLDREEGEEVRSSVRLSRNSKRRTSQDVTVVDQQATSPLSTPSESPNELQSRSNPKRSTRTKATKQTEKNPPTQLKTADLYAILPKPRRRPDNRLRSLGSKTKFDIHSSSSSEEQDQDSGEDELQHRPRRGQRKALGIAVPANTKTSNAARSDMKATPAQSKALVSKTYTRLSDANKENVGERNSDEFVQQDTDEEGSTIFVSGGEYSKDGGAETTTKSKEMIEAAKKFAEIDKWELDFENCDIGGGGSSSPWR